MPKKIASSYRLHQEVGHQFPAVNSEIHFGCGGIDKISVEQLCDEHHLKASFALRYQVYCKERCYFPEERYPTKSEEDVFDKHSIHFGAFNSTRSMLGTVRLVAGNPLGLPLQKYWQDIDFPSSSEHRIAEISRLAIARNRPAFSSDIKAKGKGIARYTGNVIELSALKSIALALYRAIYQSARDEGITHLYAAMEKSLVRLLKRYHFPFIQLGKEVDYYGMVAPYRLEIKQLDSRLLSAAPDLLNYFRHGPEAVN